MTNACYIKPHILALHAIFLLNLHITSGCESMACLSLCYVRDVHNRKLYPE